MRLASYIVTMKATKESVLSLMLGLNAVYSRVPRDRWVHFQHYVKGLSYDDWEFIIDKMKDVNITMYKSYIRFLRSETYGN